MSYVIKAVLSNPAHPEYGQATIPFPIPREQYDQTIEMLQAIDLGFSVNRDCKVDEIDSRYSALTAVQGTLVNLDQLDYLAKRLDGFCAGETSKFEAMTYYLRTDDIADFINLTFCCQQTTVITDFSDLERIGKNHVMTLKGGGMTMDQYQAVDGRKEAIQLIESGCGTVTPYGVIYDNGMKLEQVYNGHQFPAYPYENCLLMLEVTPKRGPAKGKNPEYLCLPASEHQIERALLRVGVTALSDAQVRLDFDELPEKVAEALDMDRLSGDDIPYFNRMCSVTEPLKEADREKLNAVVLMTRVSDAASICRLAENLGQFDFIPGVQTPEEYGRYIIRRSGHFDYDENLESFYNYQQYGEQSIRQQGGQFNECGYVAYQGAVPLEELLREYPAEQDRQEEGPQMGGMA